LYLGFIPNSKKKKILIFTYSTAIKFEGRRDSHCWTL